MAGKLDQFPSGADVGAYVVDLGSSFVRAGNAGDDCPRYFGHSYVGETTSCHPETLTDASPRKLEFPVSFTARRENYECLFQPSKRELASGLPTLAEVLAPVEAYQLDRDAFEAILQQIFRAPYEQLKGKPMILSEPSKHNRAVREAMGEVLFETFETEAVYTVKAAVLACFAVGRSGGLVIDIGAHATTMTPVVEGYTLQKNIMELPIGGNLLDYQLACLFRAANLDSKVVPVYSVRKHLRVIPNFPTTVERVEDVSTENCRTSFLYHSQREVLRWMRESIACASEDPLPLSMMHQPPRPAVNSTLMKNSSGRYTLPDGTAVDSDDMSQKIPEVLFNFDWILGRGTPNGPPSPLPASLLGVTGLTTAVAQCIQACDVDARRDLLSALIISGGCSLTPGLSDRATRQFQDMETVFGSGVKYKVLCPTSTLERRFLQWIGASILASLASFQQMWMSRSEYLEHGISLLERRCIQ